MRMLPVALATVTVVPLFGAEPASVGGKPWCAQIYDRGGDGGRTCGYVSWAQCRATTGLQEGFCLPTRLIAAFRVSFVATRGACIRPMGSTAAADF